MINIICFGKIKEKYLKEMICDYQTRISKYHKINIIELKDSIDIIEEEKNMLKHINEKHYLIVLDINGKSIDSPAFSKIINQAFNQGYGNIDFVVGSSNGVSENIKEKANLKISFGNVTYPHGLFRGLLLEQIYRSFKILNNEEYHK